MSNVTPLKTIEQRRAARKAALKIAAAEQRAIDLEAIDALEQTHGDANVGFLEIDFEAGLPVVLVGFTRCDRLVLKRYQARLKHAPKDTSEAAEEVGLSHIVYPPEGDVRAALLEKRPGVLVQVGVGSLALASGRAAEEAKS